MERLSEFKDFVKKYPTFATYVSNKTTTWQNLYELWDMYGDDDAVFSKFKTANTDLNNVINSIKNINMDNVRKNLNSVEKGIKMLEDLIKKDEVSSYEPRPIFKRFED